ncbi:methionine biosynthesis protein MetW [Candidatus Parcubacteria bacterium]|nr:methionine biosynthesis protein MetW [Candidatus Parcubacteria bacterium]
MSTKIFENNRWSNFDSPVGFRHRAALDLIPEGTVLDLGCGDGVLLQLLQKKGTGLDISDEAIRKANDKGIEAIVCDFSSQPLPFADSSFDSVAILDVLEHLYYPDQVLHEAARVAKKSVVLGVPNFNSLPARLQVLRGKIPENNTPHKGHIYWFNWRVLKKMLHKNGLKLDSFRVNTFWELVPFVGMITKTLALRWPSVFALSFVVRAKKI